MTYTLHFEIGPDDISTGAAGDVTRGRVSIGPSGSVVQDLGVFVSDPESGNDGVREWTPYSVALPETFDPRVLNICQLAYHGTRGGPTELYRDAAHFRRIKITDSQGNTHYPEFPLGVSYTAGQVDGTDLPRDGLMAQDGGDPLGYDAQVVHASTEELVVLREAGYGVLAHAFVYFSAFQPHRRPVMGRIGFG